MYSSPLRLRYHGDGKDERREVLVVGHRVAVMVDGVGQVTQRSHKYSGKQELDNRKKKGRKMNSVANVDLQVTPSSCLHLKERDVKL